MPHSKPSTFTPVHPFNFENPKEWASTLGNMDWDTTHICFTKRSLLDFMKQAGLPVGTNFSEIQKLPKYATFGKFSKEATAAAVRDLVEAEIAVPTSTTAPRPSRKVRDPPGGVSSISFGEYEETDALSLAPPKPSAAEAAGEEEPEVKLEHTVRAEFGRINFGDAEEESAPKEEKKVEEKKEEQGNNGFRPTRKVREAPGGNSSLSRTLFGGYDGEDDEMTEAEKRKEMGGGGRKKQIPRDGRGGEGIF